MTSQLSYEGELGPQTVVELQKRVVGRERECELVVAALMSGRHLLLEGPPGTGKSTILRAIADSTGSEMEFVEGNAELTPARLVGNFDPAQVLEQGYGPDIWIDGPLLSALRHGNLLYIEEINRVPEETLNLLVTVMSERELTVPRLGRVMADPGFRLVAAMNPYDSVGTARISAAIYDRICRLAVDYQDEPEEVRITQNNSPEGVPTALADRAVAVVRALRGHHQVRVGPSVRGAIDLVTLADGLQQLRGDDVLDYQLGLDAALTALSGRLQLHDAASTTPEEVVTDVWHQIVAPPEPDGADGQDDDGSRLAADDSGKVLSRKAADRG